MKHTPRTYATCCKHKPIVSRDDTTHVWTAFCEVCNATVKAENSGKCLDKWNKEVKQQEEGT